MPWGLVTPLRCYYCYCHGEKNKVRISYEVSYRCPHTPWTSWNAFYFYSCCFPRMRQKNWPWQCYPLSWPVSSVLRRLQDILFMDWNLARSALPCGFWALFFLRESSSSDSSNCWLSLNRGGICAILELRSQTNPAYCLLVSLWVFLFCIRCNS